MIFDPQRNLPGLILLCSVGILAAAGALLPLLLSTERGAESTDTELPAIPQPPPAVDIHPTQKDYVSAILGQPIFYSDRQLPHEDIVESEDAEQLVDVSVPELNAKITGVIVTPEARLAVVQVPGVRSSVVLREGMTLDGDLAAWKVGEIQARSVDFVASNGQISKLEMQLNERALTAPVSIAPRPVQTAASDPNETLTPEEQKDRQASLAEEVRRRIAERRAQLRAQRQQQLEQQNEEENE